MSRVLARCGVEAACRRHVVGVGTVGRTTTMFAAGGTGGQRRSKGNQSGFVVLLPEIPPDTAETNSLLNIKDNPQFDKLVKGNYLNAVTKLALELESKVWRIEDDLKDPKFAKTYENVLEPLEAPSAYFDYVWSILKTLNLVKNNYFPTEGYNNIHERAREARGKKYVSLPIYFACKEMKADAQKLNEPQQRVLNKFLLEGRLSGVELTGDSAIQLSHTLQKLNEERAKFKTNVDIATIGFRHFILEPKYVGDMPPYLLKHMAKDKSQPNKGPWVVRLSSPSYKAFLEYCPEPGIRWNTWNAYHIRASGFSEKNVNNSVHIEEIRSRRMEQAQLLGFENYVELSMQTKMAGTEENVQTMLATLFSHARPKLEEEFEELKSFAASRGFEGILRPWDVDFWRRRQRSALFNVDDEAVREYFPFPDVWANLCAFAKEIFGIEIKRVDVPVWHEEVNYFEIFDEKSRHKLGGFYLDPYSRSKEKLGTNAWMLANKSLCGLKEVSPLATLVFNFQPPMYGKPSLLSFDDVHTLFGKFGHVLQHILTTVPYHEVSGTNNIEWDTAFVTQKFMTNWLGNKAIVKEMSSHFENGSKMSDEAIRNLLRSRKHMAGADLCHELYLSALDIDLYTKKEFWMDIMKNLWPVYHAPLQLDKRDSHVCAMTDIFSGDFAAAYYCKLWSQMLAADAYQQFVEKGRDRDTWKAHGRRFRDSFFAMGGGYHPNNIFRQFRGRDPSLDAILWTLGLKPMTVVDSDLAPSLENSEKQASDSVKVSN